jgi:hypothetical protein
MSELDALFDSFDATDTDDGPTGDGIDRHLPDGVYLNMDPAVYFAQEGRLGSSDVQTLHQRQEGWWWQSRHNPMRPAGDSTNAQNYGSALHVLMLEGEKEYERRFMIAPDKADYPGLLVSTDDIKAALQKADVDLKGSSKFKKEDWVSLALANLPDAHVWDAIDAAFKRAATLPDGSMRPSVTTLEDRTLRIMRDAALDASTDEGAQIRELLLDEDNPALAEVTVLWTDAKGRKRRGRLDRLWPKFTLDLKSMRGQWNGRALAVSADDMIKKHGYDIQRADHHEARRYLYAMVAHDFAGLVHGGTAEQRAWLATFPDIAPRWDYVWLCYQKPDMAAGDAPVVFPIWDDHASSYHVRGLRKAQRALDFYSAQVNRYGLDKPWSRIMEVHYTDPDIQPCILTYDDQHPSVKEPYPGENAMLAMPD